MTDVPSDKSSDVVILEVHHRLVYLSESNSCPLYSPTWRTCAFDVLMEMLDDYETVDREVVIAHEEFLQLNWSPRKVQQALSKCGDNKQCIPDVGEEENDSVIFN